MYAFTELSCTSEKALTAAAAADGRKQNATDQQLLVGAYALHVPSLLAAT